MEEVAASSFVTAMPSVFISLQSSCLFSSVRCRALELTAATAINIATVFIRTLAVVVAAVCIISSISMFSLEISKSDCFCVCFEIDCE